jgi:AcrR family transcriptional regulator
VVTELPHKPLRSDARDNRERILEVARAAFGADGLGVPMREIARRAEVGPATLYRRFPTRQALITEAFAEQMTLCTTIVEGALADQDPWHGFCRMIERVCELHAHNRASPRRSWPLSRTRPTSPRSGSGRCARSAS